HRQGREDGRAGNGGVRPQRGATRPVVGPRTRGRGADRGRGDEPRDRPAPVPVPAYRQGAHERDLSQARRPQPRRGREARPAPRDHLLASWHPRPGPHRPPRSGGLTPARLNALPVGDKYATVDAATHTGPETALLFPGQGSQTDDMRELVERACPELLERATDHLGVDPFERVDEGTAYAQPALYCASLAGWTAGGRPTAEFMAGHSLGELAALGGAGRLQAGGGGAGGATAGGVQGRDWGGGADGAPRRRQPRAVRRAVAGHYPRP